MLIVRSAGVFAILLAVLAGACARQGPAPTPTLAPTSTPAPTATALVATATVLGPTPAPIKPTATATVLGPTPAPIKPTATATVLAPTPAPIKPTATPTVPASARQEAVPRPILHLDVEATDGLRRMVTRGVYPDGRDLGILLRASGAVWSPSGTQFAYVTPSGMELNLVDLQGEERTIYASTFEWQPLYAWPVWSPDGRRIAVITVAWCGGSDRISWLVVIDVAEGKISPPYGPFDFWEASGTEDGPKYITLPKTLRWSPDGRFIMVSWDKVVAIDAETGDLERISDTPVVAEWAPGGNAIYYFEIKDPDDPDARSLGAFHVRQLGAAAPVKLLVEKQVAALGLAGAGGSILGLMALSPTGSKLAFTPGEVDSGMGRLQIYGLTEEPALALDKPLKTFETEGPIAALEWAPDETSLAAIVRGDQGATLMVLDLTKDVWTTLATPTIDLEYLDDLGRILSWAR